MSSARLLFPNIAPDWGLVKNLNCPIIPDGRSFQFGTDWMLLSTTLNLRTVDSPPPHTPDWGPLILSRQWTLNWGPLIHRPIVPAISSPIWGWKMTEFPVSGVPFDPLWHPRIQSAQNCAHWTRLCHFEHLKISPATVRVLTGLNFQPSEFLRTPQNWGVRILVGWLHKIGEWEFFPQKTSPHLLTG